MGRYYYTIMTSKILKVIHAYFLAMTGATQTGAAPESWTSSWEVASIDREALLRLGKWYVHNHAPFQGSSYPCYSLGSVSILKAFHGATRRDFVQHWLTHVRVWVGSTRFAPSERINSSQSSLLVHSLRSCACHERMMSSQSAHEYGDAVGVPVFDVRSPYRTESSLDTI